MSKTLGSPSQDLPDPVLPGTGGDDVIGRPDGGPDGIEGIGHDLPTRPVEPNPAGEPDPTRPGPSVPGLARTV